MPVKKWQFCGDAPIGEDFYDCQTFLPAFLAGSPPFMLRAVLEHFTIALFWRSNTFVVLVLSETVLSETVLVIVIEMGQH